MNQAPIVAEFSSATLLVAAKRALRADGYAMLETFSPYPVWNDVPRRQRESTVLQPVMLVAGTAGALVGVYLRYDTAVASRDSFAWLELVLISAQLSLVFAAVAGLIALIVSGKLARHKRIPETRGFDRPPPDLFILAIYGGDAGQLTGRLRALGATKVRGASVTRQQRGFTRARGGTGNALHLRQ